MTDPMILTDAPTPVSTPYTAPFWEAARDHRLVIQFCTACQTWVFHPRIRCPACGAQALQWRQASGHATLWSYIIVHRPEPAFAHRAPYVLGVARLQEGPHMLGIVEGLQPDPNVLAIDMPLRVDFEPRGTEQVPIWRPAERR